jgi:hypothetical protein
MSFRRVTGPRGAVSYTDAPPAEGPAAPPCPGAARMLAVAHALSEMLARGETRRSDLASALQMSEGRLSQLLDLVLLAPDIQEEILLREVPAPERALRYVVRALAWDEQRRRWAALLAHGGRGSRDRPWAGEESPTAAPPARPPRSRSAPASPPR